MNSLECHVYYDSTQHPEPPAACSDRVDLHADPAAGDLLVKLGLSPHTDLPAALLSEPGGRLRIVGVRLAPEELERLAAGLGIPPGRLLIYSSDWCPDCRRAKRVLEEAETPFEEIDIDQDPQAEAMVLERSGGRRVVPTLRFDDRLWAFNPDPPLLRRLLQSDPCKETPA
jgi:glutaredoxin